MKRLLLWIFGFAVIASPALADEPQRTRSLEAVEFIIGRGTGDLDRQGEYVLYPLMVAFDFPLKPLTRKFNFDPASLLQCQVEPFFSYIDNPASNIETGATLYLKTGFFPQGWTFQPFLKIGAGVAYMTLHTYEQGSQLNFIEQGAAGFHFFLSPKIALNLEYRARHLSNGDSSKPNRGINTFYYTGGVTYKF